MIQEIKNLRVNIDGLAQLTKELKPLKQIEVVLQDHHIKNIEPKEGYVQYINGKIFYGNSKEIEKTIDSLYLAKAWLGKVLGELGTESPYQNDGNRKTVVDIEQTADTEFKGIINVAGNDEKAFVNMNHIEKVDWLREEIKKLIVDIRFIGDIGIEATVYNEIFMKQVAVHLSEARFWLGFELERIREENK